MLHQEPQRAPALSQDVVQLLHNAVLTTCVFLLTLGRAWVVVGGWWPILRLSYAHPTSWPCMPRGRGQGPGCTAHRASL